MKTCLRRWPAFGFAVALLLAAAPDVRAQSFDGEYGGKMACGILTESRQPLSVDFSMKVSGGKAMYEREILRPGPDGSGPVRTGSFERGMGTVSAQGDVLLRGKGDPPFVVEGEYKGQIQGNPIKLTGTQRWMIRGAAEERSCEVELRRL
jgi:hypothetical protein